MGFISKVFKGVKNTIMPFLKPIKKVLGWLFKIPDMPDPAAVMVEKQGSDHPIPLVYGTRKIGVIKVHKYVTDLSGGAENELLHLICVLCEGEIDAIEEVFFDGVSETDPRWRKDKNNANSAKWFTVHRYLGAANQAASGPAVTAIPNWTNSHTLNGLAYLYIVLQMDKDQSIWRGEPEITARVRGRKIADPRTNTTAYSTNPALQLLDYLQSPIYGKGLPLNRLDQPSFITAANVADQTVNSTVIVNGTPTLFAHKRFTGNQVVDTGNSVFSNVQQMLSAMRGSLPIGSGVLRLQIERDASPVFYFSHGRSDQLNHATITGKIKSSGGSKKDRYNRVVVRFPNAALEFERDEVFYPDSEDPQFTQWLAEDNGVLLEQNFEFNTITNKAEALQMARIIALRSRFQLQCSFVASPAAIVVEPGDVVGITDDTRGWDAKPFRVEQVKLKDDGDVELEFIEHQNAIYPWSGTTYAERIGGTNLGDPTNIPAPTGLSIAPDLTLATGGRLTWSTVNNAFIRRFKVQLASGNTVLFSEETAARSLDLPLLAPGNYTLSVFAISTLGTLSPPAFINFELSIPVPPTSIQLTSHNFEIEAQPVLAGAGLGTQFEFDCVEGDGAGHTPVVKGRGPNATFVGLKHNTLHTVFARTINALGNSGWVSASITTTNDASNVIDLIKDPLYESVFEPVVIDLQQQIASVENQLTSTERELKVRIQAEQVSRQATDKQLFDTAASALRLRQDLQLGLAELKDATFEVDPASGQIRLRAFSYTDNAFNQASFLIDGVNASVNILAQRVTTTEDQITQSTGEINVLAGQIALRATYTEVNQAIAGAIDAILPAYSFGFFNSSEGWTAVNGSITPAGGKVNLVFGDIQNTQLSYDAIENPVISISLQRNAGSGWQGDLLVTFNNTTTVTYAGVIEPVGESVTVRNLNLAGEASYTGTVTGLRLVLGQTSADQFTVNSITIGKPSAALTEIEGLTAQVNQLGIDINAVDAKLTSYVTTVFYNNNTVTFNNAAQVIDGNASVISLKATQQQLNAQGTVTKANSAAQWIDGAEANITQVVTSFNAQPGGVNDQLANTQQNITNVTTELNALTGKLSDQIVSINTGKQKTNDLSKLQFFTEFELYKQRNNQLDQGSAVAIAERELQSLATSQKALSQELLTLNASFGIQTGQVNASLTALNQTIANESQARAASINALSASTNDQFSAQANIIQQVQAGVDGNAQSITGISNRVGGLENFSEAQLILNSAYNQELDQLESRAFLGVTNVVNGVATIAGLTIGGGNNAINFQGDVFGLTNTAGTPVLYWTNNSGVLNIRARLVLQDGHVVNNLDDIRAQDGAPGAPGAPGQPGQPGQPGATGAGFYGSTYAAISWTTATANQRFTELVGRAPVQFDIFTQTLSNGTDSQARQYINGSWVTVALQVNGSIIALGSIAGDRFIAGTEITAPLIKGGTVIIADASVEFMSINRALPFGASNDLVEWYGPRTNGITWDASTQQPIYTGMTKANAKTYKTKDGSVFFGGSFSAGVRSNSLQTTLLIANPVREMTFGSNGGLIELAASLSYDDTESDFNNTVCPTTLPAAPSATVFIEQFNGSSWVIRGQATFNGTVTCIAGGGGDPRIIQRGVGGTITFTDSARLSANRTYRARAVISNHFVTINTQQSLSITSSEE